MPEVRSPSRRAWWSAGANSLGAIISAWLSSDTVSSPLQDGLEHVRTIGYDAAGCMRKVDQTTSAGVHETTTYVCGQGGRRTLRKTVNHTTNTAERVIDSAGLAEIRPDAQNGPTLLVRLTVAESTVFEDARNLSTGARIKARSMYLHKDLRGSVLAQTPFDGAQIQPATSQDYDAWGQDIAVDGLPAPEHAFVDHEPDPGLGYYHFGARVYDPSLRRWLSPDPLLMMLPGVDTATGVELNLYAYARNNPVGFTDPSGLAGGPGAATLVGGIFSNPVTGFMVLEAAVVSVAIGGFSVLAGDSVGKQAEAETRGDQARGQFIQHQMSGTGDAAPSTRGQAHAVEKAQASQPAAQPPPEWQGPPAPEKKPEQPAARGLPPKVQAQIAKQGLPQGGDTPFVPKLSTNKAGQQIMQSGTITEGPWKGQKGPMDTQGRIWARDEAHAGIPEHFDVQVDGGKTKFRVGLDGNRLD